VSHDILDFMLNSSAISQNHYLIFCLNSKLIAHRSQLKNIKRCQI